MTHAPGFDLRVAAGGYAWWYIDALSADGRQGLTIIAFVGSVFSPSYARERRAMGRVRANPERHCAINVALYRDGARDVWAFTEHRSFAREPDRLRLGRSSLCWRDGELQIDIDERTAIVGRRMRGRVILRPESLAGPRIELDAAARHRWYPLAPLARVEVDFGEPNFRFSGSGYHDMNEGDEGLEDGFTRWDWLRTSPASARSVILYDVEGRPPRSFSCDRSGIWDLESTASRPNGLGPLGPVIPLPRTGWGLHRNIRADVGTLPKLVRTLEDTPFYSRSLVSLELGGQSTLGVHESVDLRRFGAAWVRFLLPFRIRHSRVTSST